jgi:hypothetical protein
MRCVRMASRVQAFAGAAARKLLSSGAAKLRNGRLTDRVCVTGEPWR